MNSSVPLMCDRGCGGGCPCAAVAAAVITTASMMRSSLCRVIAAAPFVPKERKVRKGRKEGFFSAVLAVFAFFGSWTPSNESHRTRQAIVSDDHIGEHPAGRCPLGAVGTVDRHQSKRDEGRARHLHSDDRALDHGEAA